MSGEPRAGSGRPRDPEIDRRVLTAARQLLVDEGLGAMSLDAVAERAGVSRSAIYRRWDSVDELALDAVDDALGQLSTSEPGIDVAAFWQEVREGIQVAVDGLSDPVEHDAVKLWLTRLAHQPRLHQRYWDRRVGPRREQAINSLRHAAAHGEVDDAGDPELLVDMLAGVLVYRFFLTPAEMRSEVTDEEWLDRLVALAERLLSPRRDA